MDPLLHTAIATGMVAASFYYGVYKGRSSGFGYGFIKGIEETLSHMSEGQIEDIAQKMERKQNAES